MGKLTRRTGEESDARDISIGHFLFAKYTACAAGLVCTS